MFGNIKNKVESQVSTDEHIKIKYQNWCHSIARLMPEVGRQDLVAVDNWSFILNNIHNLVMINFNIFPDIVFDNIF